jgi:hypothetical protein
VQGATGEAGRKTGAGDMGAAIFNLARRLARTASDLGSTTESSLVVIYQVGRVREELRENPAAAA